MREHLSKLPLYSYLLAPKMLQKHLHPDGIWQLSSQVCARSVYCASPVAREFECWVPSMPYMMEHPSCMNEGTD